MIIVLQSATLQIQVQYSIMYKIQCRKQIVHDNCVVERKTTGTVHYYVQIQCTKQIVHDNCVVCRVQHCAYMSFTVHCTVHRTCTDI